MGAFGGMESPLISHEVNYLETYGSYPENAPLTCPAFAGVKTLLTSGNQ